MNWSKYNPIIHLNVIWKYTYWTIYNKYWFCRHLWIMVWIMKWLYVFICGMSNRFCCTCICVFLYFCCCCLVASIDGHCPFWPTAAVANKYSLPLDYHVWGKHHKPSQIRRLSRSADHLLTAATRTHSDGELHQALSFLTPQDVKMIVQQHADMLLYYLLKTSFVVDNYAMVY